MLNALHKSFFQKTDSIMKSFKNSTLIDSMASAMIATQQQTPFCQQSARADLFESSPPRANKINKGQYGLNLLAAACSAAWRAAAGGRTALIGWEALAAGKKNGKLTNGCPADIEGKVEKPEIDGNPEG